jgi:hypothetical protein
LKEQVVKYRDADNQNRDREEAHRIAAASDRAMDTATGLVRDGSREALLGTLALAAVVGGYGPKRRHSRAPRRVGPIEPGQRGGNMAGLAPFFVEILELAGGRPNPKGRPAEPFDSLQSAKISGEREISAVARGQAG